MPLPRALTAAEMELDVSLRADPVFAPSPTHVGGGGGGRATGALTTSCFPGFTQLTHPRPSEA